MNPFTDRAYFDFDKFQNDIYIFNRMLDNVIEIANLPLKVQQDELIRKRRHGIGYLGLGSMFNMMKLKYGEPKSVELTAEISKSMAISSINAGIDLAIEKGSAPIMNELFTITSKLIAKNPKIADKFKIGDQVSGKQLLVFSDYMQRMPQELRNKVATYGMRFSHATSIAPTGTMALGIGNNCCVAKGAMVKTLEGDVLIEEISSDKHKILVYIPSTDNFEYKEIEFCGLTRPNATVLEIELEDNTILKVTPDHKILIKNSFTHEIEYIEAQHLNIYEHEIVSVPPANICKICNTEFLNRRSMIAHISKKHKVPTNEYQYFYENHKSCSVCHKPMTIDQSKSRFRYGQLLKDQTCSDKCSFDAKFRNESYFMKFYNITYDEARSLFLKKYENRASLPNQLEHWIRKGYSEEAAKEQVSLSQNRTSLESFIIRYGEIEGTQRYNEFCETRSIHYSGENNPRFGAVISDSQKISISNGVKKSLENPEIINNIVNGRNNSDNIQNSSSIGVREIDVWNILTKMNIDYSIQFSVIVPEIFKSESSKKYIVYDILLPKHNCVLEINEYHHNYLKHRLNDKFKYDIAINLGYKYAEVWITDEITDTEFQLSNIVSKLNNGLIA